MKRYQHIKKLRSASERANSTLKDDLKIIEKPRVLNGSRADILAQIATIVLLLKRAFSFIIKTTNQIRRLVKSNDPTLKAKFKPPFISKAIRDIIQLE